MNDIIEITRTEKVDLKPMKEKIKQLEDQQKEFDKAIKIIDKLPEDVKQYVQIAIPNPNEELDQLKSELGKWQKQ